MSALCKAVGLSRQAYYRARQRETQREDEEKVVLTLVRIVRARHPRMGTRKLLHKIRPMLAQENLRIGRDRLFALLKREDLLISRARSKRRTTWGGRHRYPNRIAGREVTGPNQVWVVDITYLSTSDGRFLYLFIVMDLYSRTLLGWALSTSLEAHHAVRALQQALTHLQAPVTGLIHHSDHGVQYTSHAYQALLAQYGIQASMGAVGNAYENAYAERVLGTLKHEYLLEGPWASLEQAEAVVRESIMLYNTDRPHMALNGATPMSVYEQSITAAPVKVKEVMPCP